MIPYTIYLVDDEPSIQKGIAFGLGKKYNIISFSSGEDAISAILQNPPDLVLLDIGLPGISGLEALTEIKKLEPDILVIMITAYEDIDTVISAMKRGAQDYIIKPIQLDSLKICIQNALDTIKLRQESDRFPSLLSDDRPPDNQQNRHDRRNLRHRSHSRSCSAAGARDARRDPRRHGEW